MQNYCKTIGALAAASALAAGNATAFTPADIEYELSTGYASEYIFRGVNEGQDLIDVGIDAATEINGFGLSAGAWYASFQNSDSDLGDELNLYTEATYDLGFLTAGVGYIYYYFPSGGGHAQEVPISIYKDFGIVETSLAYFWDVRGDNDGYTELNVSNETELNHCLSLNSGVAVGYLAEKGNLAHITASVALDYAFTETATLSPFVAHSWALTEKGVYGGSKNQLFGGVRLAVSF